MVSSQEKLKNKRLNKRQGDEKQESTFYTKSHLKRITYWQE